MTAFSSGCCELATDGTQRNNSARAFVLELMQLLLDPLLRCRGSLPHRNSPIGLNMLSGMRKIQDAHGIRTMVIGKPCSQSDPSMTAPTCLAFSTPLPLDFH